MRYIPIFFLATLPQFVFAAGLVTCDGPDCNLCTFMLMVKNVISLFFGLLVIVAVLLLVIAGFKLVVSQGNSSAMSSAKSMISNVIIGFVIILSAWLIVDTVMKSLIKPTNDYGQANSKFGMWNSIPASACEAPSTVTANEFYCSESTDGSLFVTVPTSDQCDSSRQQGISQGHQMNSCHLCTSADYNN